MHPDSALIYPRGRPKSQLDRRQLLQDRRKSEYHCDDWQRPIPVRLLEVIDEALQARLIEEAPGPLGHLQFAHALIHETLVAELSTNRRVRFHARIAETLEELYGAEADRHATELAHYFAQAESVLGTEKLVHYSLLAGEQALATYAYGEAVIHFQQGLAAKGNSPMDAETAMLLFDLGRGQLATLEPLIISWRLAA